MVNFKNMTLSELEAELLAWRRLCHASDRTWWRRLHGTDLEVRKGQEERGYAIPSGPFRTAPPPEIMLIVEAARQTKNKSKELEEALSYFD